jgi:hypothetical protein
MRAANRGNQCRRATIVDTTFDNVAAQFPSLDVATQSVEGGQSWNEDSSIWFHSMDEPHHLESIKERTRTNDGDSAATDEQQAPVV